MPKWNPTGAGIKPLLAYHGTDDSIFAASSQPGATTGHTLLRFRVNLALCRPNTDFGQGFYLTTSEHQAREWAKSKVLRAPSGSPRQAVLLRFALDAEWLASLEALCFARGNNGFWDLLDDCRIGFTPHQRVPPLSVAFDVVFAPVSLWPQKLLIQDCDQISFHTARAIKGASLRNPYVEDVWTP